MYYYVYRITNKTLNRHYYGKRQCKAHPSKDLGVKYFSSSKDADFIKDQKENPDSYRYKVIAIFNNDADALAKEIKLHQKLQVDTNKNFYNRSIQTSDKWSTAGRVSVRALDGTALCVPLNHPDYLSGVLVGINTGRRWTEEEKLQMSKNRKGTNNGRSIYVNIYDYYTDACIAEKVLISEWCKNKNYNQAWLAKTVHADRDKPHYTGSKYKDRVNHRHHKGIYAVKC